MPRIPMPSAFFKRYTFATDAPDVDADVSYVELWMFAVDDGDPTYLAFSGESDGSVIVGRFDPMTGDQYGSTSEVLLKSEATSESFIDSDGSVVIYEKFSDHGHVYAHGYHWIAVSMVANETGYGVLLVRGTISATGA